METRIRKCDAPIRPTFAKNAPRAILSGWIGGKFYLARKIINLLPWHICYCEPFCGAAWVLFKKTPSPLEILNDVNGDICHLYRTCQHNLEGLLHFARWAVYSREDFLRYKQIHPENLADIERAWRFFYLQKTCFSGGMWKKAYFATARTTASKRLSVQLWRKCLQESHDRLGQVVIENQQWHEVIDRYDSPVCFFYIDPPYVGCEHYYGRGIWQKADYYLLADKLKTIKGKFLLSINDCPLARELFAGYRIMPVQIKYCCKLVKHAERETRKIHTELFIMNYDPEAEREKTAQQALNEYLKYQEPDIMPLE